MAAAKKRAPAKRSRKGAAAKASEQPAAGHDIKVVGPDYRDGELHMSGPDLSTFELARLRWEQARDRRELLSHRADRIKRDADTKLEAIRNDLAAAGKAEASLHVELVNVRNALKAVYGIDFAMATYDDKTGKVFDHDQQPITNLGE